MVVSKIEQYVTLAPSIAMVTVTNVDLEKYFYCTVTATKSKCPSYQVRRKWEDFELLSKSINAVLASRRYTIKSGTIFLNGVEKAELPQIPKFTSNANIYSLDSYVKNLLLLPKEILQILPLEKFFGNWVQDNLHSDQVSGNLSSKLKHVDIFNGANDDFISSILKWDRDLKSEQASFSDDNHRYIAENYRKFSQLSEAKSFISDSSDMRSNADPINRASELLTYEEFVTKLATSLAVDLNEKASPDNTRDTITDTVVTIERARERKLSISTIRTSTQSLDTVIASPVARRNPKSGDANDLKLRKNSSERYSLPPRTFLSRMDSIGFSDDAQKKLECDSVDAFANVLQHNQLSTDNISDVHKRKDFTKTDLSLRNEQGMSDLAKRSHNREIILPIVTSQKSPGNISSPYVESSNSSLLLSPVAIPSRKESKNWSVNSPEGPRSSSSLARRVAGKDIGSSTKSLKVPIEGSREESINAILRATARRSPDLYSQRSTESALSKPTSLSLVNHFTIKLIQTSGESIAITVPDGINFTRLVEKISPLVSQMNKLRICYRDSQYELIIITDDISWELCKDTIIDEDKLTLFLVKKTVLNAMAMI